MRKPKYEIVRSRRKTVAIHVYRDGRIEVRAPHALSRLTIASFVARRTRWIERTSARLLSLPEPQRPKYADGETFFFLGAEIPLAVGPPRRARASAEAETADKPRKLTVHVRRAGNSADGNRDAVRRAVRDWYRRHATRLFSDRLSAVLLSEAGGQLGRSPSELRVRRMKRRWGSCSGSGVITLNTALVAAPPDLIDYVIVHELCHLVHLDHSPRFYALLTDLMPDWRKRRKRLNDTVNPAFLA